SPQRLMERQKRKADIEKGLQFIQSTLPLKQEEYEAFLLKLVQNLFAEGNDLFREKDHKQALVQYMEGLNVADYAASDQVALPRELLCKLHVNRAACYFTMGLYEKALEDSEKALGLDSENIRALFRKARALNELGRHKEAYECSSRCSLALPHDESVTQLGQELAQKLGLRVRKAYKRPQHVQGASLFEAQQKYPPYCTPPRHPAPLCPSARVRTVGPWDTSSLHQAGPSATAEPIAPSTDCYVDLRGSPAPLPSTPTMPLFPHVLDLLAPLDSGSRVFPSTESLDDFSDGDVFGPELDTLLDSLPLLPPVVGGSVPVSSPLPPASFGLVMDSSKKLAASMLDALDPPGSTLDSLDLLPYSETRLDALDSFGSARSSLDKPDSFSVECSHIQSLGVPLGRWSRSCLSGGGWVAWDGFCELETLPKMADLLLSQPEPSMPNTALLIKNPLAATHEFKQACQLCYPKTGPRAGDYTYREGLEHKCKRDILLGRLRSTEDQTWKRIRPRPTKTSFVGSYYLCKDMINKQDCKYGDNCTFAYHQEEIDVWTEERKGTLNRDLLFDPLGGIKRGSLTIAKLLKEHQGIFTFLCEICFDSKPRIISKGTKDSPSVCSNLAAKHSFHNNKCLVHIVRSTSLKYSKIRQFQEHFQFDVCRHEVRYGCLREDSCHFAHSFIELKVWLLQQYSGMTHEDIVQESKKYWQQMEAHTGCLETKRTQTKPGWIRFASLFVRAQCSRQTFFTRMFDRNVQYGTGHHPILVSWPRRQLFMQAISFPRPCWESVRETASCKNQVGTRKSSVRARGPVIDLMFVTRTTWCYSGPEPRRQAHASLEERGLHGVTPHLQLQGDLGRLCLVMEQAHHGGRLEGGGLAKGGEQAPTVLYPQMGYHCWLCGKNSNSKKQWQQHIQSEKHKEKVFTSDSDASAWAYRFPMGEFRLCDRCSGKPCPDGDKCRCAHGQEELNEWLDRREVLKQKLAKARKDMLLCPRDDDFGKYNFLLQEGG
uniref:Zinc finger CCCH-type containing 7B n=1 Tax=Loxodonta africana TaxID=9785 RepID=G3UF08_LOXAF